MLDDLKFVGDVQRLKQILVNLISNAYKFTFSGYIKLGVKIHQVQVEDRANNTRNDHEEFDQIF